MTLPTSTALSEALFNLDPMGTCCRENEAANEYSIIAEDILDVLHTGVDLDKALRIAFEFWFGAETLNQPHVKERIKKLPHQLNHLFDN